MKRLFLVIILFTLPMLACAITPELEGILALIQFEIVTTIQEDGSGVVELGIGSNEKKEDGEYLVECTDDQLEDLPPGATVAEEFVDDLRWCRIQIPFPDLLELGGLFQESAENSDEDSGLQLQPNCLLISDGLLYYDVSLITNAEAQPTDTSDEGGTTDTSFSIPYIVIAPGPIYLHNADERQGNTLTWNMITATDGFRINMAAGDSCPDRLILDLNITPDGSGEAMLTVPIPPTSEDIGLPDNLRDTMTAAGWTTSLHGETEQLQKVVGKQSFTAASIDGILKSVPGLADSAPIASLVVDADTEQHTLDLSLDLSQYASYWATILDEQATPWLYVRVTPAGVVQEATEDWLGITPPLQLSWNPEASPEQIAASLISAQRPADGDGDGVLDDADLCLGTPTDTLVDSAGCPITSTVVVTTAPVITRTSVVTTTPAITTTPGIAAKDGSQQAVGDNGFVLALVPAGEVLDSFSVFQAAELLDASGDLQSFQMEVSYVVTDGPFGFDELFELQSNISGPGALPAQMQVYLVGETAAALVDGDWTVLPRDDSRSAELLGGMDTPLLDLGPSANFWETEVWQTGRQLNWQAVETTEYGGVLSVHYVALDLPVETDADTVLEMDVWVSLQSRYVVAYEATVQTDEGTIYISSLTQEIDEDFSVTLPPDAPALPDVTGQPPVSPPESELMLLFADEFNDPESGWHVGDFDHGWVDYEEGVFVFYALDPNDILWSQPNQSFDDTSLVVEATQVLAPTNNNAAYGVACRIGADGFGGYLFLITVDGAYAILKDTAEEYVTLVDWTDSDTIRQGEETNVLAVVCDGSSLSLSVNGEQLAQVNDSQYSGGDIALLAMTFEDEAAETQFDNLEVRAVSPSPSERTIRPKHIPHRAAGDSVTGQYPMPDDAVVITAMEGLTFYTTVMGVQDVADFYLDTMSGLGWEYDGLLSQGDEEFALLVFYDSADTQLRVVINHEGDGTKVTILETLAE